MPPIFSALYPGHSPPTVALTPSDSSAASSPTRSPIFSPALNALNALKLHDISDDEHTIPSNLSTPSPTPIRSICCVGAGYVGGPTAAVIAYHNPHIRITVVDRDPSRIRRWQSPHLPIYEPGLPTIVRIARDGTRPCSFPSGPMHPMQDPESCGESDYGSPCGRLAVTKVVGRPANLFFSTEVGREIAGADVVMVAVNTPTKKGGLGGGCVTDMTAFEAVVAEVARWARPGAIIVEKSTVPCRTAEMVKETMSIHRPDTHFEVLSNPEFLAAGTAVSDLLHPSRILIGAAPTPSGARAAEALASVYASWIPRSRILTSNVFSSELAKLVANSFLAQRISSINSISALCEDLGADVDEVARAIGADPRIGGQFLKAGLGFGGSCFRKDVLSLVYIAESLHRPDVADFWRAVVTMNEGQRTRFVRRIMAKMNGTVRGKKLVILGYAFKKNTSDTRESPALEIIRTILEEGPREIAVFDPCCNPLVVRAELQAEVGTKAIRDAGGCIEVYDDPYVACADADAIIIATEFDEFRSVSKMPRNTPTTKKSTPSDPRPFRYLEPSADDLLSLQVFVQATTAIEDAQRHLLPQPDCASDCPDCVLERQGAEGIDGSAETVAGAPSKRAGKALDWERVAEGMRRPKWVFDGRGVVDRRDLERFGMRVESIGRMSERYR